jgi:hypothetical protein
MDKPIIELIDQIDAAFACDAGVAIDALGQFIELRMEEADPILRVIHFKLCEAREKSERLCQEARHHE